MIKIGNVCKCQHGILGVVTSIPIMRVKSRDNFSTSTLKKEGLYKPPLYKGISLSGKSWQSRNPTLVAETIQQYIECIKN